jgi:adenylylsulfate kinase-like enzyme
MPPEAVAPQGPQPQLDLANLAMKARKTTPFLLLLNGFPGVGKLTLARNLSTLLVQDEGGLEVRLLDNHLLIDPVSAIEPERTPYHYQLRKAFRDVAFSALKNLPAKLAILMTDCLSETVEGRTQFEEYLGVAEVRECTMVVCNLVCGEQENRKRLGCEKRRGSGKLMDITFLERFRREYRLLDLERLEKEWKQVRVSIVCEEFETTDLTAHEGVGRVWAFLMERLQV